MNQEDKEVLNYIHNLFVKQTGMDSKLIFRKEKNKDGLIGGVDNKNIYIYEKNIEEEMENLDEEHMPSIDIEVKKKMLLIDILAHEFTHLILNKKCKKGKEFTKENKVLINLLRYTNKEDREFLVRNSTILNDDESISMLSGRMTIEDEPVRVKIGDKVTTDHMLYNAHEFAAHIGSQFLMYSVSEELMSCDDENWQRVGFYKENAYNGMRSYMERRGLATLSTLDFMVNFNKNYEQREKEMYVEI